MGKIYMNYGTDMQSMVRELMNEAKAADSLNEDMHVVIKPNLVVPRPAKEGATTHPEVVEGIVQYLQKKGIRKITIAEGAWVGERNTGDAFKKCGYTVIADKYGVELMDTKKDDILKLKFEGLDINVCKSVYESDYVINVPVLKGHCQTKMTCCLKNMKGCIPDSEKRRYHTLGLHKPIAALNAVMKADLNVVDSVCGDLTFEEGGNPVESNRIMIGYDPVLVDSYGAMLMGYRPEEIRHLVLANEYGVGNMFDETTEVIELNTENKPKTQPARSSIVKSLAKDVDDDAACSACYANLIFALNKAGKGNVDGRLKIGQGWRGKKCEGTGIGNCASGCERYVKGCPPTAVDVLEFLSGYSR